MSGHPQAGTILLGKYRVESMIGSGGMSYVLRAVHLELEQAVAIKCLRPEMLARDDQVQRFLREAKACSRLRGPNITRVMDVGRLPDSSPIMVMEYLEGADLGALLKAYGAQDVATAIDLLLQACEGLAEAHGAGIIHRDIKSSNFFIVQHPNQPPLLKVLDFGIATAPTGISELTADLTVLGTPGYMSPEQMRSTKEVDQRSDIWSLGVVLYELVTGIRPFIGESYASLCFAIGMDPPLPITREEVGPALRHIIEKCLHKSMDQRFQNVAELAVALIPFAHDPALARGIAERCTRYLDVAGTPQTWDSETARDKLSSPSTASRSLQSYKGVAPASPSNTATRSQVALAAQAVSTGVRSDSSPAIAPTVPQAQHEARSGDSNKGATPLPIVRRFAPSWVLGVIATFAIAVGAFAAWKMSASATVSPALPITVPGTVPGTVSQPPVVAPTPELLPATAAVAATTIAPSDTPATSMAKLTVTSAPQGAKVWRGETMIGVTPLDIRVVPTVGSGTESLRIEMTGRIDERRVVSIQGEVSLSVDLKLPTKKPLFTRPKNQVRRKPPDEAKQPLDIIKNR